MKSFIIFLTIGFMCLNLWACSFSSPTITGFPEIVYPDFSTDENIPVNQPYQITIKAMDPYANTVKIEGKIVETKSGQTVKTFEKEGEKEVSITISFQPEQGKEYKIYINASSDRGLSSSKDISIITTNPPQISDLHPSEGEIVPLSESLSWKVTDPDGDPIDKCIIYIREIGQTQWKEFTVDGNTSSIQMSELNIKPHTSYEWKVKAFDSKGAYAESDIGTFSTGNSPPHKPEAIHPEDGKIHLPTEVTLSWQASDPNGDSLTYDLYFGKFREDFSLIAKNLDTPSYTIRNLTNGQVYFWKVVAKDGYSSTESDLFSFKTNAIPEVRNPTPADQETNVDINPSLQWEAYDEDGDSLKYDVYLGTGIVLYPVATDITQNTFQLENLNFNTTYYWQVVAKDDYGGSKESPIWSFKTRLPKIIWQKCLGGNDTDRAGDIVLSGDGNYIIAGYTESDNDGDVPGNHGSRDVWIVKLDKNGNILWSKTYGGSNKDKAWAMVRSEDGGYVFAGYTYSNDGDVSGNHGSSDYWVVKLDEDGNIVWKKCFGGSDEDGSWSSIHGRWRIIQTKDGNYVLAGYTKSSDGDVPEGTHGESDFWVLKINSDGKLLWQKTFGGSDIDDAHAIIQTDDGGYLVRSRIHLF